VRLGSTFEAAHRGSCGVGLFEGDPSSDSCDADRWCTSDSITCSHHGVVWSAVCRRVCPTPTRLAGCRLLLSVAYSEIRDPRARSHRLGGPAALLRLGRSRRPWLW
jgi:hypothetical protein